jgi:hypothetical protein
MTGVLYWAGVKDFSSSLCSQTGSGAHPASYSMGNTGSFPEAKARLGSDTDHSPPSSAKVKNKEELYLLLTQNASVVCRRTDLLHFCSLLSNFHNISL